MVSAFLKHLLAFIMMASYHPLPHGHGPMFLVASGGRGWAFPFLPSRQATPEPLPARAPSSVFRTSESLTNLHSLGEYSPRAKRITKPAFFKILPSHRSKRRLKSGIVQPEHYPDTSVPVYTKHKTYVYTHTHTHTHMQNTVQCK